MDTSPRTLTGAKISLVPLELSHVDGLCQIGLDPDLWLWVPTKVKSKDEMLKYVESALADQSKGLALPFAILELHTGKIVGTTRLGSINRRDNNAEIGWSWIAKPWQRSAVNTESKFLLLRHAFESWGCVRIEFTTDAQNEQSRAALNRIGASLEGILRKNRIMPEGRIRDTAVFSITDEDWPRIKELLIQKLATNYQ